MPRAVMSITDIDKENQRVMGILPRNRHTDAIHPGMMLGEYQINDITVWDEHYYAVVISGDRVMGDVRTGQPMITLLY